ncbi:MAG: DUF2500 domain-containing protein [Propionicimonas sp.]|nr:DUF2500 domain-containing protein [Propionicimonas sp.]
MGPDFDSFDQTFQAMQTLVVVGIIAVVVSIVVGLVRRGARELENSQAPEVTAVARIVDKRVSTTGGGSSTSAGMLQADGTFGPGVSHADPITQRHFVTFEQSGGERFELEVPAGQYGLLVVGDDGTVTMKGTRYLGFTRELLR